ncbi:acetylornithine deacetylase [Sulfitobacter undariae]|uniref:Acetylornithine deacetylase n=1 Tax=Sulfitobacter undariae TaxID=1563671 RepID=A0A7W6H1G3_9RHOB|nr:acetylornithine deacetylase [Sulfitobacter undariae]MBB3995162.1 acetylornithine deacetylase [Sulfitobacter undariae]
MSLPLKATDSHPALENTKAHLRALIGFDTVSKNANLGLIDHMAAHFEALGGEVVILPDETGQKANLVARFGPADVAGVVLSGHTDVVPAEEGTWITPPFNMDEREGRLYGRGTCDMKGFGACVMTAAEQFSKMELKRPLWLCFSHDEEVGCLGAPAIAAFLAAQDVPPELAIIGEPSNMRLITGQKGKIAMRVHVKGTSGHSSFAPSHVNAIEYASRIIGKIAERATRYGIEGPLDEDFSVPQATMLTTMITGGVATNVTPEACQFTFELRSISGMDPEADMAALISDIDAEISAEMAERAEGCGVEWERIFAYPPMGEARESAGYARYADLMPEWGGKVSYGSEGGVFEITGKIPSVIIGPGSIDQAHKANEFVELTQLSECLNFLENLSDAMTRG